MSDWLDNAHGAISISYHTYYCLGLDELFDDDTGSIPEGEDFVFPEKIQWQRNSSSSFPNPDAMGIHNLAALHRTGSQPL